MKVSGLMRDLKGHEDNLPIVFYRVAVSLVGHDIKYGVSHIKWYDYEIEDCDRNSNQLKISLKSDQKEEFDSANVLKKVVNFQGDLEAKTGEINRDTCDIIVHDNLFGPYDIINAVVTENNGVKHVAILLKD